MQFIIYGLLILITIGLSMWEKLTHHFDKSIFKSFSEDYWNPLVSWKRKYKDNDPNKGVRFPFSDTFLSWTVDAYHLIKSIVIFLVILGFWLLYGKNIFWGVLYSVLLYAIVFGITFNWIFDTETTFRMYLVKKVSDVKNFFVSLIKYLKSLFNKKQKNDVNTGDIKSNN